MTQLESVMPDCRAGILTENMTVEQNANIFFATSMYSQREMHLDTLLWAIDKLDINLEQPVVSFLNAIQQLDGADAFTYYSVDSILDADTVIDILSSLHIPRAHFGP